MSAQTILSIIILVIVFVTVLMMLFYAFRELRQIISGYGVPFVPTPDHKVIKLLENVEFQEGQTFVDIGCGDGRILQAMSEKYPKGQIIGYENSKRPYKLALKRRDQCKGNYTVLNEDFFLASLENVDVIYVYMLTYLMPRIWKKIQEECKLGTLLYSSGFAISWETIYKTIDCSGNQKIYVYKVR